jgi:hypothetical protein
VPNTLSFLSSSTYKVTNDPTATIAGNVPSDISANPYAEMTDALLFSAINLLLQDIDDATGLDLLAIVSPLESLLGGSTGLLSGLLGFITPGSTTVGGGIFGPLLGLIPGLGGGTGTLGGLGSFLNPTSFLGAAAGIFSPLLSSGSLLSSLIPGLDASKIISGFFPISQITNLPTLLGGFGTGSSIITQLIGVIPGLTGGLTGLGGLGSIFTDLTHILGSPTGLGGGSPTLPSIGSIPLLGGLLSGGSLLTSLIPGLDASKIISGFFSQSQISGLPTLLSGLTSGLAAVPTIVNLVTAITGSSGGLSDITTYFDGLVPLDQLVSAITGNPGDLVDIENWVNDIPLLGQLVGALTGSGGGLLDLTNWSNGLTPLTSLNDLKSTLGGTLGDDLTAIESRLGAFLTPSSDLPATNIIGTLADGLLPSLGSMRDAIRNALTGVTATGATTSDAHDALAAQNAILTGVNASVARLNTTFTSGVSTQDLFEFSQSGNLGASWDLAYTNSHGNIFADGHNAAWSAPGLTSATNTVVCRWVGANPTSSTDYQRVEMILNSAPGNPLIGSAAANDILLRMDTGKTNFIRIRFRADNVAIVSRVVAGVETVMGSVSLPSKLSAAASIGGEAGKAGTARFFRPLFNGFPVGDGLTESGAASMVGPSFRGWGQGMFAGADNTLIVIPAQSNPGSIKQWTAADIAF